jgi:BolA protein
MTPAERLTTIQTRLQKEFLPVVLEVIDDSHLHVGHAGSRDGAGHYTVVVMADCFRGKNRVAVHREIYAVLADLIPLEIHALQIKLVTSY